jgi:predicted amidohydrolase
VRITAGQFAATTDKALNREEIQRLVADAAKGSEPPALVVLPEASMHDFGAHDLPLGPIAEPLDGPFVDWLADLARTAGCTIVAGMFEPSGDDRRPYNTLVAVGSDGDVVASYRKIHLYDSFGYRESDRLLSGDGDPVTFVVDGMRVGLMTCYDLRFPEVGRALVDTGAQVFLVPAAWLRGPLKEDHWLTLLKARAIENTVYVVGAAQTGPHYCGGSVVVDPMGVVVAAAGEEPGLVSAEVSSARLKTVRERNPSLANRRLLSAR